MKAFIEATEINNQQITVPLMVESVPDTLAFQFEVALPAQFKCVKVIPNPKFTQGGTGGMFLSNPNLKGKVRVVFASAAPIKLEDKTKLADLVLEFKNQEVFDINESFSAVWGSAGKLDVEMLDSTLRVVNPEEDITAEGLLKALKN